MHSSRIIPALRSAAVALVLCATPSPAVGQKEPPADWSEQAKALAKEAEDLARADKVLEARAKYIDALKLTDGSKIEKQYQNLEERVSGKIRALLKQARPSYESGQYAQAMSKLNEARLLRDGDPAVLYNIALVKMKMGERLDAVALLGQAADSLADDDERGKLKQLETEWETGQMAPALGPYEKADAVHVINAQILHRDSDHDGETCDKLGALTGSTAHAPAVVFNLAKCAEDEGDLEEASRLLDRYLRAAPDAVDAGDIRARDQELQLILSVEKRAGPEVLKLYADADRDTRWGRYRQAVQTLEQAEAMAPDIEDTQLRLARLLQSRGDLSGARARYERYLRLESDPQQRSLIEQERDVLEDRAGQYKAMVDPAADRLRTLFHRYVVEGRPMGLPAAQQEVQVITGQLQRAALMIPLTPDVNMMLGQIYLQSGNYVAARKSFSAATGDGSVPIWFYAKVNTPGEAWKKGVMSKVEIGHAGIRIVGLAHQDRKTKKLSPFGTSPGPDALGGFLNAYGPACNAMCLHWDAASITALKTSENAVTIARTLRNGKSERSTVYPLAIARRAPPTGPAARRFSNTYMKLFRDFGDIKVELGAESMTKVEKLDLIIDAVTAASNAWDAMHVSPWLVGATLFAFMESITWATSTVQSSLEAQRRMFRELDFKMISIDAQKPTFRTELFK
jgi:tetratricopeptide (TPR) repeat protein